MEKFQDWIQTCKLILAMRYVTKPVAYVSEDCLMWKERGLLMGESDATVERLDIFPGPSVGEDDGCLTLRSELGCGAFQEDFVGPREAGEDAQYGRLA